MDLFNQLENNQTTILPFDGEVFYFPNFLNREEDKFYFNQLKDTIEWKFDEVKIFGKHLITKRKMAWYGEKEIEYTYSGISRKAFLFNSELLNLKNKIENKFPAVYNSCLLNLYHNGEESMGWHSDNEKTILENSAIASLSLGAERKFSFKHKITKQLISIHLTSGSLLIMAGTTQKNWLHSLPKSKKVNSERINLTFRNMI